MRFLVGEEDNGLTVRLFLRQRCGVSETALKSAKWNQRIFRNLDPVMVRDRVHTGDVITIVWADETPRYQVSPYDLPLNILYQDEYMLVVDKPAPLASQSSRNHPDDSLENAVYAHLSCPADYVYRPVNRLDKGTSGLMVIALTAYAQNRMQELLHTDRFIREYLAVTEGSPDKIKGTIDAPIRKAEGKTICREVHPDGKACVTHYEVIFTGKKRSLLRLRLETGRTHQIRVHLSSIGCPVAGDFLYGNELTELPGRFALHSCFLSVQHPVSGEQMTFSSSIPQELQQLLDEQLP